MKRRKMIEAVLACAMMASVAMTGCGAANTENTATETTGEAQEPATTEVQETVESADYDFTVSYDGIQTNTIKAGASVHDPSIYAVDGTYYIYGSHMSGAASTDLRNWSDIANGYSLSNPLYDALLKEEHLFDYTGYKTSVIPSDDRTRHIWAPDVIYNEAQGLYFMYFCTSSTWNASNLCYATSEKPEGPFKYQDALIYSGITAETLEYTDVLDYVDEEYALKNYVKPNHEYNFDRYPNAIDPTVFYDKEGKMWMVYGSWSGGIFILELDPETGLVIHPEADSDNEVDAYFGKRLLGGKHKSIEGPYILYDAESDYYYLYVSYGALQREGGYQIRVFRSKEPNGTYEDMSGNYPTPDLDHSFFGLKLSGNYYLPSLDYGYMATGHNSAFIDADGKKYIVFHTRFDNASEEHEPRVHQYLLNKDGWPCMLPYATDGETVSESGYDKEQVIGKYYVINQGMNIDSKIAEPIILYFTEDGKVVGDGISGEWFEDENSYQMSITYNDTEYQGVFCEMNDEAGTKVMTFSAVGANTSVWGVKYE